MGRIAAAISAGRQAVAQAEAKAGVAQVVDVHALLAPGLPDAALAGVLVAFRRVLPPRCPGVLICDRLPTDAAGMRDLGFEHLVPMADLLAGATPAHVLEHQARRTQIILARRGVAECHWVGDLACDLMRHVLMLRASRGPVPALALAAPLGRALDFGTVPVRDAIFRPLKLPD